jgi:3-hydroxyacyl-[acyl-carrier-protein] dehydratase
MSRKRNERLPSLPCPAEFLVPHRPPMLFIDSLIERTEEGATAMLNITETSFYVDPEHGVLPEFFIEIIAQTMAAASGYDALAAGKAPGGGYLVAIDTFKIMEIPERNTQLLVETKKTLDFGQVKIIKGRVVSAGKVLAEGELKVWETEHEENR